MGSQVAEKRSDEMIQAKRTMASLTRKVLFSEELEQRASHPPRPKVRASGTGWPWVDDTTAGRVDERNARYRIRAAERLINAGEQPEVRQASRSSFA